MTNSLDFSQWKWTHQPQYFDVSNKKVSITTEANTDLWQRTYYHFQNDNAPIFQMNSNEQFFSFVVKTDFSASKQRFDQCGIVVYLDSENWLKASVEYENDEFQYLGSVVTNGGYSDWATTEIPITYKSIWYRLSRRGQDFRIEYSWNGQRFHQMRICHLQAAQNDIQFGIYACSPENSSFTAIFTDMALQDCQWLAHDGQQPD